jgi:hypothetical protein
MTTAKKQSADSFPNELPGRLGQDCDLGLFDFDRQIKIASMHCNKAVVARFIFLRSFSGGILLLMVRIAAGCVLFLVCLLSLRWVRRLIRWRVVYS